MHTAHGLARDLVTAEAVEALRIGGIRSIVLKGASIARWLYGDGTARPYADCDLLVDPAQLRLAARALEAIGYVEGFDDRLVSWRDAHHVALQRGRDGARIELHWRIPGVRSPDAWAWRTLSAGTETASLAGVEVEFLGVPARAVHIALHAAQHGPLRAKPVEDLRRAVRVVSCWDAAAGLASALDAQDAFAAGLRTIPEGAELAGRLGLPRTRSLTAMEMLAAGESLRSVYVQGLVCNRGAWGAARELLRVAIPLPDFMRYRYAVARRGRVGLAAAYAWRLVSLGCDVIPVFRSVARANARRRG